MSAKPWHKRYHSDALSGMLPLTLDERGAYQTVLDLIYDRGGPIVDNERLLAGYMNCSIRKWRSLRETLIEKGKLALVDGHLTNSRAKKEIENDAKTSRKRAENGAKGGRVKAENSEKPNENKQGTLAGLEQSSSLRARSRSQRLDIPPKSPKGDDGDPVDIPDWVPAEAWAGFEDMRKRIRHPLTSRARELAIIELEKLRDAGYDPGQVLDQSTLKSWRGLFKVSDAGAANGGSSNPPDFLDFKIQQRRQREEWERQRKQQEAST